MGIPRQKRQIQKIMIVEDELDILLLYKDFLKSRGYYVISSSTTADEALIDYERYVPDLVIIDYKLPGKKNGLQAAKEILTSHRLVTILIITAFEYVKNEIQADQFFIDKKIKVLIKPVKLSHLADTIMNINN